MSAQVIPFPARRFIGLEATTRATLLPPPPPAGQSYVLTQHQGAVELLAGAEDGDPVELWFTGEQAISLGEDLIRLGRMALLEQEAGR